MTCFRDVGAAENGDGGRESEGEKGEASVHLGWAFLEDRTREATQRFIELRRVHASDQRSGRPGDKETTEIPSAYDLDRDRQV
jgi:hypothetical protein